MHRQRTALVDAVDTNGVINSGSTQPTLQSARAEDSSESAAGDGNTAAAFIAKRRLDNRKYEKSHHPPTASVNNQPIRPQPAQYASWYDVVNQSAEPTNQSVDSQPSVTTSEPQQQQQQRGETEETPCTLIRGNSMHLSESGKKLRQTVTGGRTGITLLTDGSSQPNMIRDGLAELARLQRQANGSPGIDDQPASTASFRQRMVEIYK